VNGDAIYGTRPWRVYGEGPTRVAAGPFHDTDTQSYTAEDCRFTTKGNDLFAIELGWSDSGQTVIHALSPSGLSGRRIRTVAMLGSDTSLVYQQSTDGLHIKLPPKPGGENTYAFRIGLDGPAQPDPIYR
jgi:alpha-L-fucosidase